MASFIYIYQCRCSRRALFACVAVLLSAAPLAAENVPPGDYSYDSDFADVNSPPPITGIAGFDGSNFFTPGVGSPIDTFRVVLSGGLTPTFPDVIFSIDSGFEALGTIVIDVNLTGMIDAGDDVSTRVGPGTFSFTLGGQLLLGGSFDSASFTAKFGGASGALVTSVPGGLDLFPGPAFQFDGGTFVEDIFGQEGFAINLTSIPEPFVATGLPGIEVFDGPPAIFTSNLLEFGVSNGSVNTSGMMTVGIPEPSTLALGLVSLLGLVACGHRRRRI